MSILRKSPESAYLSGMASMKSGNLLEAIQRLTQVVKSENRLCANAYWNLGVRHLKLRKYPAAAINYTQFYRRTPGEFTSQAKELIAALEEAAKLPQSDADSYIEGYKTRSMKRQSEIELQTGKVTINEQLDRVDHLIHEGNLTARIPLQAIGSNLSAGIPLRVYSIQSLSNTDPSDAFGFCTAFISYGIAIGVALSEADGNHLMSIKGPPYNRSHSEKELEQRSAWDWLFVSTLIGKIVDVLCSHFMAKKPWAKQAENTIKDQIIKDNVLLGFSIALESGDL